MDYGFLKPKTKEKDYSFLSAKKPITQGAVREVGLPEHLGGGRYLVGKPFELVKEERGYSDLPTRLGMERDHIISVALGGTSGIENLEYKPTTQDGRQQGKVEVEQQAIQDYLSGKISLNEARLKVATKQQQIKGLVGTEREKTWQGQIGNVIKDAAKSFVDNLLKPFSKEAREKAKKRGSLSEWEYNKRAEIASKALGENIKPEEYDEKMKELSQEEKDLIRAVGYESSVERAAKVITAPIRYTAGTLATAVTSYALEKANDDRVFTPQTDAEKLIIGETEIKRLLNQEDIYGIIARGAGVPVALLAIAIIENPFLAGTGAKQALSSAIKKQANKNLSKLGARGLIKLADDVIKAETKAGRLSQEVADNYLSNIKKTRVNFYVDPPKIKPLDNVIKTSAKPIKQTKLKPAKGISEKLKTGKTVQSGKLKYLPEETPIDLRKKIKTERLIAQPSLPNRIKDETIAKGLKADFRGIEEYDKTSFERQAKLVGEIIDENPQKAINIALGKDVPTNGALPESVFMAVKNQAIKNGDTDLLVRLATEEGGVAKESTILGQRIKMLDENLETDAFGNINKVVKSRRKIAEKRLGSVSKAKKKTVKEIKSSIPKIKVDAWTAFIKEITC